MIFNTKHCIFVHKYVHFYVHKINIMIVINPTELRNNQKKYFDLAETKRVVIKRGRKLIELKVTESISPSNDSYYEIPENIAELERRIKELKSGNTMFTELTPELQKELLG